MGRTTSTTDQRGVVHAYTFDSAGRLAADTVTSLGSSGAVDGSVRRIGTSYDDVGRVRNVTSYDAATGGNVVNDVQDRYDGWGNLFEEWQSHQGAVDTATTPSVQYAYDDGAVSGVAKYNRLTAVTYPNGRKVSYDYSGAVDDIMSRLSAIYDDADNDGAIDPGEDVYAAYKYLGAGTIVAEDYVAAQTKLTYLDSGGDVVWLDRFGRVADQVWEHYYLDGSGNEITDGTPDAYAYGYDRAGNRTSRENLTKTDGTLDESYSYDGLDRLTEWKVNGTTEQTWSLDSLGNDRSAGTYNAVNEETPTSLSSGYDAAGNMTTLTTGDTAIYDAWNRMTEVDDASGIVQRNAYDGTNRRIEVSTDFSGTTPDKVADDYLAGQQVIESDQTAGGVRAGGYQMIWSPRYIDAPILRDTLTTSRTGIVTVDRLFYLGDANYNVTGLMKYNPTSCQWEAVERYSYKPYGDVTVRAADWSTVNGNASLYSNTTLYTGRVLEPATGLMYYRARSYDSGLERFVGRDPIRYYSGDRNLYRYVSNSPVDLTDASGNLPWIEMDSGDILKRPDPETKNIQGFKGAFKLNSWALKNTRSAGPFGRPTAMVGVNFTVEYTVKNNLKPPVKKYGLIIAERFTAPNKKALWDLYHDTTEDHGTNSKSSLYSLSPASSTPELLRVNGRDGSTESNPPVPAVDGRGGTYDTSSTIVIGYLIGVKCKDPVAPGWLDVLAVNYTIKVDAGLRETTYSVTYVAGSSSTSGGWLSALTD